VLLARVVGTLVATVKHETLEGQKLLFVRPVDVAGAPTGPAFVAVDGAQAGEGDYVLVVEEGKSARQVIGNPKTPCEAIIVGVIDHLTVEGRRVVLRPKGGA